MYPHIMKESWWINSKDSNKKDMSIEEYKQIMELLVIRTEIKVESRITMDRFQSGLQYEIWDMVELLSYNDLNNLIQLCIKIEQQLKKNIVWETTQTLPNLREIPRGKNSMSTYESSREKEQIEREDKERIKREEKENERKETSLFGVKLDIEKIFHFINKPC